MEGVRIFVVVIFVRWIQLTSGSCTPGKFGDSCSYSCHCGTSCDGTGACPGDCGTGWMKAGGLCQKQNIALSKTASTTSGVVEGWYPSKAVDGDSDIDGEGRTCFHAARSPSDWTVDLGQDFQLYEIRIYSRGGYYLRNANSNIYLNSDPSNICSTLPSPSNTPNPTDVTCNGTGRYVTIKNPDGGPDHDDTLNICEVEIYSCSPGIYGVNCDAFCHCLDSTCDRWTGLCSGDCKPGWHGERCDTACTSTTYGKSCKKTCAWRKCSAPNSSCDRHTGACDTGCLPGWIDDDCTQACQSGKYGSNCSKSCDSRHCETAALSCDHVTGACAAGCRGGWTGRDCTQRCKPGTYGAGCSRCGHCDVTCNDEDGRCPGECLDGFTGDRCDVDVRVSPVTSGVIGGAVVLVVMLMVIGGLMICLLRSGRLKWIPSSTTETSGTGDIHGHANTSGMNEEDYTELNDVTSKGESQYDVIQNKV